MIYLFSFLFDLPTSTTMIAGIGEWSKPLLSDFMPLIYLAVGFFIGMALVAYIIYLVVNAISKFIHRD